MINVHVRLRTIPQDRFVFSEAVKLGEIEVKDAFSRLIIEAEILIDADELKKVAAIPEVATALQQVVAPQAKQYSGEDWRAKQVVMRDLQWQQKPVIDYIAKSYKEDIIQAFKAKLKIPNDWANLLLRNMKYIIDPKALQLSPKTEPKYGKFGKYGDREARKRGEAVPKKQEDGVKWRSIYVLIVSDIESSEGFLGKFATEFNNAVNSGQVTKVGDEFVFQTTLTGLESTFKTLDPYAGTKLSSTQQYGWDVADEPGYDAEIKSAFVDHFSRAIDQVYPQAHVTKIDDNGQFSFTAQEPEQEEDADSL